MSSLTPVTQEVYYDEAELTRLRIIRRFRPEIHYLQGPRGTPYLVLPYPDGFPWHLPKDMGVLPYDEFEHYHPWLLYDEIHFDPNELNWSDQSSSSSDREEYFTQIYGNTFEEDDSFQVAHYQYLLRKGTQMQYAFPNPPRLQDFYPQQQQQQQQQSPNDHNDHQFPQPAYDPSSNPSWSDELDEALAGASLESNGNSESEGERARVREPRTRQERRRERERVYRLIRREILN